MAARRYAVDFPTLAVVPAWIEAHCVIPDGFHKGREFLHYPWQLWCAANHWRVKPGVDPYDENGLSVRGAAFHNRRSQVMAPQKVGKGPQEATWTCAEAKGPVLLHGWADADDGYACSDNGCGCGFEYPYDPGEPMGMAWPTPLIQLMATSEDQVDNAWRPLQSMIRSGPLSDQMLVRETFIRVGEEGRVDAVTASALSRLGNPITAYFQDESGLYTITNKLVRVAETMRRGAAAMGGRGAEFTNPYDPSEHSVAQRTHEARAKDVFKFYEPPPPELKWNVKADRRKIIQVNYVGAPHVPTEQVEAEAAEINETDPGQAERFYGNRIVAGLGHWCNREAWDLRAEPRSDLGKKPQVVVGFDGSDVDDWTGLRCQTQDGYQFTPAFADGRPMIWDPSEFGGQVPRLEVDAAVASLFSSFDVVRMYCDPPYWSTEIDAWADKYGKERVARWTTFRPTQMHGAAERLLTDVHKKDSGFTHDGCEVTGRHIANARKAQRLNGTYVLTKPGDGRKIDLAMSSILCNEAAGDVTAAKLWKKRYRSYSA